jgi:cell division protein FtsL
MAAVTVRAGTRAGSGAVPSMGLLRRLPGLFLASLALAAVAGVGLLQVLQSSRAASAGYEIHRLEDRRDELNAQIRLLEVEVANMSHSDRIQQQATTRLGMVPVERTMKVAVGVPAPRVAPLPERYVPAIEVIGPLPRPWWIGLLESVLGTQ